jgi:hypothetical protein
VSPLETERDHADAYARKLGGEDRDNELILGDLARFCFAAATTVGQPVDIHQAMINEGRRQVWNHIASYVHMDRAKLANLITLYSQNYPQQS